MAHSAAIGAGLALVLIGIGWGALLITLAASDNGLTSAPSLTAQPMTERSLPPQMPVRSRIAKKNVMWTITREQWLMYLSALLVVWKWQKQNA